MPVSSLHAPSAVMSDTLRRRAERLLAEGASLHVEADATGDLVLLEQAIDLVEDAVALFNEFDPDV